MGFLLRQKPMLGKHTSNVLLLRVMPGSALTGCVGYSGHCGACGARVRLVYVHKQPATSLCASMESNQERSLTNSLLVCAPDVCQSWLPQYFNQVLGVELQDVGLFAVMPYLASLVVDNAWAVLIDYLIATGTLTTLAARRFSQVVAFAAPSVCIGVLLSLPAEQITPTIATALFSAVRSQAISICELWLGSEQSACASRHSGSTWRRTLGTGRTLWIYVRARGPGWCSAFPTRLATSQGSTAIC